MNKSRARDAYIFCSGSPTTPDFIVLYSTWSDLFSKEKDYLVYGWGKRLDEYLAGAEDQSFSDYAVLEKDSITFKRANVTFPSDYLNTIYGRLIYVYPPESKDLIDVFLAATKWQDKVNSKVRLYVKIFFSAILAFLTFLSYVREEAIRLFPNQPPAPQKQPSETGNVLERTYKQFPEVNPLAIVYGRYSENCDRRIVVEVYSPMINSKYFDTIRIRSTQESGWAMMFAAHRDNRPHIVKKKDLEPTEAMHIAMQEIGVEEMISVPIPPASPQNCAGGYLLSAFTQQLSTAQETQAIDYLSGIVARQEAWKK